MKKKYTISQLSPKSSRRFKDKKMKDTKNLLKVAKREKTFATLAKEEGKGAAHRAKIEHGAAKKDSQREEKIDMQFARKRTEWSKEAKMKATKEKRV